MRKIKEYTLHASKRIKVCDVKTEYGQKKITNSDTIVEIARQIHGDSISVYESFYAFFLTRANTIVGFAKIGQGGTSSTPADIKLIIKYALDTMATAIILVHNHPSGNTTPSAADINVTKKVKKACEIFDISLLDHIILSENTHYSFAKEDQL